MADDLISRTFGGLRSHIAAARGRDPATANVSSLEIILTWPGVQAVLAYRLANRLRRSAIPLLPFAISYLSRAITVVILIQTIFLLGIFAEIFVTTGGAFGTKTLTYLIYQRVLESQNVGLGSAGGVYAIILANIVAIFLMRIVGKNLDA